MQGIGHANKHTYVVCECAFLALGREEVGGGCPSDLVLLSLFFLFFRALLDSFSVGTIGISQAHNGQHAILLTHRDKKKIMHSSFPLFPSSPPSPSSSFPLFPSTLHVTVEWPHNVAITYRLGLLHSCSES